MFILFIFNNLQFEQMLQIHAVSKKYICITKTKVKILVPGNIKQNKCKSLADPGLILGCCKILQK